MIVLTPIGAKDSINTGRRRDCNASTRHFSEIRNKLKRDVANVFSQVSLAGLAGLVQTLADESRESAAHLREHYRERRGCTDTTKAGRPCKAWALWDCPEQKCAAHFYRKRGPGLTEPERFEREKKRKRPTCDCPAYSFPHRRGNGLCCWPEAPMEVHPLPAGQRKPGKKRRRDWKTIRKRLGI